MTMRRSVGIAAALVLLLGYTAFAARGRRAEAALPPAVLPRDMAGCYLLRDRHGEPASSSLYFAPSMVELDTAAGARPSTWRLAKRGADGIALTDERSQRGWQYWAAHTLPDSVRIIFHTGYSGTELIVPVRLAPADTLRGRALQHWDMGPSTTDGGPVTAVRVSCAPSGRRPG